MKLDPRWGRAGPKHTGLDITRRITRQQAAFIVRSRGAEPAARPRLHPRVSQSTGDAQGSNERGIETHLTMERLFSQLHEALWQTRAKSSDREPVETACTHERTAAPMSGCASGREGMFQHSSSCRSRRLIQCDSHEPADHQSTLPVRSSSCQCSQVGRQQRVPIVSSARVEVIASVPPSLAAASLGARRSAVDIRRSA